MINVYLDPFSYVYLDNALFKKDTRYNRDDVLLPWHYLKNYCFERNINLNTIDFWNRNKATAEDIYVSFEHKNFLKKLYWRFKNKRYPTINLDKFKKKILFQFEPPISMPEVYTNIDNLFKIYDKLFFVCKLNNPKVRYFHYFQTYDKILSGYWDNSNRAFLVIINSNKEILNPKKILLTIISNGKLPYSGRKELLSERIRTIEFFSRTNDIDLYGSGWNKLPPFPYLLFKGAIQRVYKGRAESKYSTLSKYNFSICYENCISPGYITEKIFDCFFAGTIPVYYGAPDIEEYIPKNCFIDRRDFKNYQELKEFLKSLTESEIKNYKENARQFLESDKFKPFTREYFARTLVEACFN